MKYISANNKYLILLSSLISFLLLSPFTPATITGKVTYSSLFLFVMIGVSLNIKSRSYAYWVLPILGFMSIIFSVSDHKLVFSLLSYVSTLIFFLCAIIIFGNNIFIDKHRKSEPIYGSICLYLLIGITYATIYMTISCVDPQTLLILKTGTYVHSRIDFYYFSFVTLTTVGFGDIIANNDFSKVVIILESITGLFYLGILVASLTNLVKSSSLG